MNKIIFLLPLILLACSQIPNNLSSSINTNTTSSPTLLPSNVPSITPSPIKTESEILNNMSIQELKIKQDLVIADYDKLNISGFDKLLIEQPKSPLSDEKYFRYISNVGLKYTASAILLKEIKEKSDKLLWDNKKYKEELIKHFQFYKGGTFELTTSNIMIDLANPKHYTIIIKTLNEDEIYRKDFISNVPKDSIRVDSSTVWKGFSIDLVDKEIDYKTGFYVYIINNETSEKYKFKFSPKSI